MIAHRTRGLSNLESWIAWIWKMLWFGLLIVIGVEVIGRINYTQTQYGIYLLGILLSHLVPWGHRPGDMGDLHPSTAPWMRAVHFANREVIVLSIVLFALVFATKDQGISRVFLTTFLVSLWPTLLILRRFLPGLLASKLFGRELEFATLVIGGPDSMRRVQGFLEALPSQGFVLKGRVGLYREIQEEPESDDALPCLGSVDQLPEVLRRESIDQVILVESEKSRKWFRGIFNVCDEFGCHVMVYNYWQDLFDQPLHINHFGMHTVFSVQDEPLQNPVNRILKRLLDIAVALPIVLVVLPPLCAWVAVRQAKQAPGPLFYRQDRAGFQRRPFRIYKFRSMKVQQDRSLEAKQATKSDDRIFPFGAFMRNRSIDEFPQFINVLFGEMSVVGPRPHLMQHDDAFARNVGTYRIRHFVKPGITGLAQVNGFRGEVTDPGAIASRVKTDIAYINSWSLGLDIAIMFRTVAELIRPSDRAY